jgi:hypothetical protein
MLADDDLAEFVKKRLRKRARLFHCFIDGVDSCAHVSSIFLGR